MIHFGSLKNIYSIIYQKVLSVYKTLKGGAENRGASRVFFTHIVRQFVIFVIFRISNIFSLFMSLKFLVILQIC